MARNNTNALAAVAVSGAAFAQVTITGSVAYGYQTTKTNVTPVVGIYIDSAGNGQAGAPAAGTTGNTILRSNVTGGNGVKASGFGVDTASITIAASEDLGGGLKASGSMTLGGITRGDTPSGEDFKMVVSGGFGSILLGQIEIGSGIRGLGTAGAPVNNMEGEVLGAATSGTDIVKYTAPKMGAFTVSGSLTEAKGLATGLSAGQSSAVTVGVAYAANGLAASLDTTDWDKDSTGSDSRYRLSAKYDLGAVAIGAGYEDIKMMTSGVKTKYTVMGVSAPMGALTVGFATAKKEVTGAANVTGNTIGLKYALSKRTSVTANTASWKTAGAASETKTSLLLNHNF